MNGVCFHLHMAIVLVLVVSSLTPHEARAVVVSTTTGNTTAPEDDFGFANVGVKGGATGVYLGYRWVLTAAHVSATSIVLDGRTYEYETGTSVLVKNPTGLGLSQYTDLRLFRITEDPWLPTMKIADTYMDAWDEVIMIGNGLNRTDTLQAWDVTGDYGDEDWVWTETDPPGDAQGYYMESERTIRWGTNRVEPGKQTTDVWDWNILTFTTDFDQYGGTEYEAQAVIWDSGGGVFHKRGDQWELVGIMHTVSEFPDQPSQAIFGLETYCSDLVDYRDQILEIITPLAGDANLDGVVDALDASILAAHWGLSEGALWGHGDFNEDGVIDQLDAAILADNWGTTTAPSGSEGSGTGSSMPGPSAVGLMLTGLVGLLVWRTGHACRASLAREAQHGRC